MNKKLLSTFIKEIVESIVALDEAKFNPRELDKLTDRNPETIVSYLIDTIKLQELGMGSSRIVFLLDNKRVLKVARNEKGLAQNKAELDAITNPILRQVFSKIYDYSSDFAWLVSELVRPLTSKEEFEELTGFRFRFFTEILEDLISNKYNYTKTLKMMVNKAKMVYDPKGDEEDIKLFNERVQEIKRTIDSPLTKGIIVAMQKGDLLLGDIRILHHYGKAADGRVVLLDYGFTEEVADTYY